MSKTLSLFSALFCTLIWGTTFIAQDTGMDKIGPLTFNGARFFIGFLSIIPFALVFEKKKIILPATFLDRRIIIFRNLPSTDSFTLYRCS